MSDNWSENALTCLTLDYTCRFDLSLWHSDKGSGFNSEPTFKVYSVMAGCLASIWDIYKCSWEGSLKFMIVWVQEKCYR